MTIDQHQHDAPHLWRGICYCTCPDCVDGGPLIADTCICPSCECRCTAPIELEGTNHYGRGRGGSGPDGDPVKIEKLEVSVPAGAQALMELPPIPRQRHRERTFRYEVRVTAAVVRWLDVAGPMLADTDRPSDLVLQLLSDHLRRWGIAETVGARVETRHR